MRFIYLGKFAHLLAISGFLVLTSDTFAQWWQWPFNSYFPVQTFGPIGNQLMGQAAVISASGDLITAQEQARILREQANQAKLDTRKQAFDLMLYERAMTPTFTEEMNRKESM